MTVEHRLAFELYRVEGLEASALDSVVEKMSISKRSHEYIRRIMVQGYLLDQIFDKAGVTIPDLQSAKRNDCSGVQSEEFKFRLNIEEPSVELSTPEDEIWRAASKISKRGGRKNYLRHLFLCGFWFETLPSRDADIIKRVFSNGAEVDAEPAPAPELPKANTAKNKLGGLMPL